MFMRVVPVLRQAVKLLWDGFTPHSPEHHKISTKDDACPVIRLPGALTVCETNNQARWPFARYSQSGRNSCAGARIYTYDAAKSSADN